MKYITYRNKLLFYSYYCHTSAKDKLSISCPLSLIHFSFLNLRLVGLNFCKSKIKELLSFFWILVNSG